MSAKSIDEIDAKKKAGKAIDERPKPIIPGLPEEDRLKQPKPKRKRKKKSRKSEDNAVPGDLSRNYFLVSPESGVLKKKENETDGFEFSDYDDEDIESDDPFEDSRETLSDDDNQNTAEDFLTPVHYKSTLARSLMARSNAKPSPTTCPPKRSASSPPDEESKLNKKSRARSKSLIPKKK